MKAVTPALLVVLLAVTAHAAPTLPARVELKTRTEALCRDFQFAVRDGLIYYKGWERDGQWQAFDRTGLPPVERGQLVREISADGDSLVAVTTDGRLYDAELSTDDFGGLSIKWNNGFGWPLRLGARPVYLPPNRAWAASILSATHGVFYSDAVGNPHQILGINTIYVLSETGRVIRFDDPWLPPNDFEFQFSSPAFGQIELVSISASGSTLLGIDAAGRTYTRLLDFDTVGGNPGIAYSYTVDKKPGWSGEGRWAEWRTRLPFLFDLRKLPGERWLEQPPITGGRVTSGVTILQTGKGNGARELRVEGAKRDASGVEQTGYFKKAIFDQRWDFVASAHEPASAFLDSAASPRKHARLGDRLEGLARFYEPGDQMPAFQLSATIDGFNTLFDPAFVTLQSAHGRLPLELQLEADVFPTRNENSRAVGALLVPAGTRDRRIDWTSDTILRDYFNDRQVLKVRVEIMKHSVRISSNPLRAGREKHFVLELERISAAP